MKPCVLCGELFEPKKNAQRVCDRIHYRSCKNCGKEFVITRPSASQMCCSKYCTAALRKQTMLSRYGVEHALQSEEFVRKSQETSMERYGVKSAMQNKDVLKAVQEKFREKYGVPTPFLMKGFSDKSKSTCLEKYGVEFTSQIPGRTEKMQATNLEKYGFVAPLGNADIRSRSYRNKKHKSSLEIRLHQFLEEYNIEYVPEYSITKDGLTHAYDCYIPKYKILVDCDRTYYHSYLDDPDGKQVRDDYDADRLLLVSEDHIFLVIVESSFESGLKQLQDTIKGLDAGVLNHDTNLFNWCRTVRFPYPHFSLERLNKEYNKLCSLELTAYNPYCKIGQSIIQHFHPSIYHCHVNGKVSPYEGWNNDDILKKCIANRLIYQNDVDPSKVLYGFTASKLAPKVSVFNPVLSRYLTLKYLSDYSTIVDPFSGFSGRMIGVCSVGKHYIGRDLNETSVKETNEIQSFLNLDATVSVENILDHVSNEPECSALLTCPPYGHKEVYGTETVFKSCDEWIDGCLEKYKCEQYVFVVDETTKYLDHVAEEIKHSSHLSNTKELVIVI